jgi:hypothetical protein
MRILYITQERDGLKPDRIQQNSGCRPAGLSTAIQSFENLRQLLRASQREGEPVTPMGETRRVQTRLRRSPRLTHPCFPRMTQAF